ncbi:MAG TPA: FlgD immunoglobulin-like domain containing protein [Candidatus Eisenbacteria bacterium]|jgi:hypothetical protein
MRSVSRFFAPMLSLGLAISAPALVPPAASAPCTTAHPAPVGFTFEPWHPCPTQDLRLWVAGCRECVTLRGIERIDSATVRVTCAAPEVCPVFLTCTAESLAVNLGRFALGDHQLRVEIVATIRLASGDSCTATEQREIGFSVGPDCPPNANLPYVSSIKIGPTPPCSGCSPNAICAGVPIPVAFSGNLTGDCLHIRQVRVVDRRRTPLPGPVGVLVEVGRDSCQVRECIQYPIPWSAQIEIPGLPPGQYALPVYVQELSEHCDGSTTPRGFWSSLEPFSVTDSCAAPAESCFVASWDHAGGQGECNAFVSLDHPADVTLQVLTSIALAGLQGRLVLWPTAGLRITSLTPVGPAAGMHVAWEPTAEGAKFAMFADQGAPIPPWNPRAGAIPLPVPVLRVTASATAGTPIPSVTRVDAQELLGSDERGRGVSECQIVYGRIADPAAHICAASACDFNGDAVTDVRDLVLMAHCVLQSGYCPPDATGHLDCDRSGVVDIDDVMCCARVFLRGPAPPGAPGRPEPAIRLSFREPIASASGVDLPVRLDGADRIGATRLAIRYPSDRFQVTSVDVAGDASRWLCLHEGTGDRLVLGLIGLGPAPAPGPLDLTLRLALRPGESPGGEVRVEGAEFAGPDGAALEVAVGEPAWSFDGPPGLALSPGEPNPFSRESRVQVTLARPATVEISVHDLGGRRVASLHSGPLAAGAHPFSWNGTRADGSVAPTGVYLVRARAGNDVATRKLVLLRGN